MAPSEDSRRPSRGVLVWVGVALAAALLVAGALWTAQGGQGATEAARSVDSGADGSPVGVTGDGSSGSPAGPEDGDAAGGGTSVAPPTVPEPVADGADLETITVPPSRTVAFVDAARATPGSEYAVEFRVYGRGSGNGLVIAIGRSTPEQGVAQPYEFTGRNVLAKLTSAAGAVVDVGGSYDGTLELRKTGDVLEPWLLDARPR